MCIFLSENGESKESTWSSIFPVENEALVYENWEDNIIWDPEVIKIKTTFASEQF